MAVNEITATNPVPPAATQRIQNGNTTTKAAAFQPSGADPAPAAPTTQGLDSILLNELLINQTLQNLNVVNPAPADTLSLDVTTPFVSGLEAAAESNPILLNELLTNEALQNLNFVSQQQTSGLLINETPAPVAATDALENLNTIQQNDLLINTTLQTLNPALQTITNAEAQLNAVAAAATAQGLAAVVQQTAQIAATAAAAATSAAAQNPIVTQPAVTTTLEPTPITATFVEQTITPTPLPFFLLNPDRTPYVVAVYETSNPNPQPGEPAPITNEVRPPMPSGRARPVDRTILRQEWARFRVREYQENAPAGISPAEKDLRYVLSQVNADLVASGLPLHLVFAKNEGGYAVDVYDCSDNEVCRVAHDVQLNRQDLTSALDNLQHETGIIINTTS